MARKQLSIATIGLLITIFGFITIGVGAFVPGPGVCPANSATIQINSITASPNPVGTGQAFQVSGSMFAGTGCPVSDAGTNYATYLVYFWVLNPSGTAISSGQYDVNYGGGFTINNIPTIPTAGSYTIVVSPFTQTSPYNSGNTCIGSSLLTCTNAQTTLTVQSTAAITYPVTFTVTASLPGSLIIIKDSSGNAQYITQPSGQTVTANLPTGAYSFTDQPNEVGTCYNTVTGTFLVSTAAVSVPINIGSGFSCVPPPSNITFNISPTIAGTVTLNGHTQNIGSNGQVTFSSVAAGTYAYSVTPATNYPNCLYSTVTGSITLPYANGVVNISPQSSNSQTCIAPVTVTSTLSQTATGQTTTNLQGSTYTTTSSSSNKPTVNISGIQIIGAVIVVFGIFTTFAGAVRGRR